MHFSVKKHGFIVVSIASLLLFCSALTAKPARPEQVQKVVETFLKMRTSQLGTGLWTFTLGAESDTTPTGFRELLDDDGTVLAYIAGLEPQGFLAVSTDTRITPVVAYSFNSSFPSETDEKNPLYHLLKEDMKFRLRVLAENGPSLMQEGGNSWNLYGGGIPQEPSNEIFQQWPAENTTSTGGWLETTWHQKAPYNAFCPLDPTDGNRSVVGCVATAMAQVVHFHRLCDVFFNPTDSYTTYNGIDIDADNGRYDFPTLEELNDYLDTVRRKYTQQTDLDEVDIAALNFACGIAVMMEYSSEGSGAYMWDVQESIVDQFGFHSAEMTGGLSHEFFAILQENIVNGEPAFLGLTYPTYEAGHVVVCDGYNTNGEYHLNFGWGSSNPDVITEAWYHLPVEIAEAFVDETILNVRPVPPGMKTDPGSLEFRATPGQDSEPDQVFLTNNTEGPLLINSVSSPEGFVISLSDEHYSDHIDSFTIQRPNQRATIHVKLRSADTGNAYGLLSINYDDDKIAYVILSGSTVEGGTDVQAGEVSGTWSGTESPYYVHGDIHIPTNGDLIVEPGVRVVFTGPYGLTIGENARLAAEGTASDPIEFTAANKELGWKGLRFIESGGDDLLSYCSITFSKKGDESTLDSEEDKCGGAIYCDTSYPTIMHCKITNNFGNRGGAIYCLDGDLEISNTLIANNTSMGDYPQAGGICCLGESSLQIDNCTIVNNFPAGILSDAYFWTQVTNTIVWGNGLTQMECYESASEVIFCDIQGGYPGEGNFDADPCFFDPSSGIGADYDGTTANWTLKSSSPCINGGLEMDLPPTDLAGNERIYSELVDIGAYENQSKLPLMTLVPASHIDAGTVEIGAKSVTILDITNTGELVFTIESLSLSDPNGPFTIVTPIEDRTLPPGKWVEVEIGFKPIEQKVCADTLHIHATNSNGPSRVMTLRGVAVSGTIVPAGEVSGTWGKNNSPYTVIGDINIPRGQTLTIEPGVVVNFAGHYRMTVGYRARLSAVGTEQDPIVFTAIDPNEGWYGIRFIDTGDDDILQYCTIENAFKSGDSLDWIDAYGGAIICGMSYETTMIPSNPLIDHCLIANNYSPCGGGIACSDYSTAVVTNNRIIDNSGVIGGGISIDFFAEPAIVNNIIAHNNASYYGGGLANFLALPSIINNTIAHNRPNGMDLDWTSSFGDDSAPLLNNIFWENEIYLWPWVEAWEYDIRFNNIQGGWDGEGNIDVDPLFADSQNRDYHLKSEAGRWDPASESWITDRVTSPCIDAGDPETAIGEELAPNGSRVNMGAYGGTSQASKSIK